MTPDPSNRDAGAAGTPAHAQPAGSIPRPDGQPATVTIERTFQASIDKVWAMWTTASGLEKWYWPAPLTAKVIALDLRDGWLGSIDKLVRALDPDAAPAG